MNKIFHPQLISWFESRFKHPSDVQIQAWQAIEKQRDVLISSPTGSGKTLAAFLYGLNQLFVKGDNGLTILYVSPLKALSNDVKINLEQPLVDLNQLFPDKNVRAASWTGDTTPAERNKIRKKPPNILVTTPESLYVLLTSQSGREILKNLKTVIIDEIHAVANSKRGAHLVLSLQRLEALCYQRPQRIAISATQKPIETMRDFILHGENSEIVNLGHKRQLEITIEIPQSPLTAIMSNEQWAEVYQRLCEVIAEHKTTLIFVNNRRLCERLTKNLAEKIGEEFITSHHGSLAKEHRLNAEQMLKSGQLKALVATASLELGIDIGDIDCVCQIGSPGNIQAFLQRVGRSGHSLDKTPKGFLFANTIDDLVELTALKHAIQKSILDTTLFPQQPLDVLAQQIVAEVSLKEWNRKQLFFLLTDNLTYKNLSEETFNQVIQMLAEGYGGNRLRHSAMLFHDKTNDELRPRKSARLTAVTNGGTIPDQFDYDVILLPEDIQIGSLNEDFSFESLPGDIFILGNHSYRILKIENGRVFVEDAHGLPPNIPFWFGVQMWRSDELSQSVSEVIQTISASSLNAEEVAEKYQIPLLAASQLKDYFAKTQKVLSVVPTQQHIVVERFFDENNDMHLVIHSIFGSRINRAWGLALRKRFCRQFNFELQAAADENTLILSLSESHSFELNTIINYLNPETVENILIQALLDRPMFETLWRWNATIALAIRRRNGGKKVPAQLQRNRAEDLIAQLFPDQIACLENIQGDREIPQHPLVQQTIHDCIRVLMDIDGLAEILNKIRNKEIEVSFVDSNTPSPTSLAIINARNYMFLDDAPAEERRTNAIKTKELSDVLESFPSQELNPKIIESVNSTVIPFMRNADELHEAIHFSGIMYEHEMAEAVEYLPELQKQGKIVRHEDSQIWFSAENRELVESVYKNPSDDYITKLAKLLFMKMESIGYVDFEKLRQLLQVSASSLQQALTQLEIDGRVFKVGENHWCERHILAKIRKQTHYQKRNSHELVSPAQYQNQLFIKHGLKAEKQFSGMDGLIHVLTLLQGYSAPAGIWEEFLIKPRMKDYQCYMLDSLCYSGQFIWKRVVPNHSLTNLGVACLKNTPITFLKRENLQCFPIVELLPEQISDRAAQILSILKEKGAMYASDIQSNLSCMLLELEEELIHLLKLGVIYCDGASALRIFSLSPAQRARYIKKNKSNTNYLDMMGRWSVCKNNDSADKQSLIKMSLKRYGILCKAVFEKEQLPLNWYEAVLELTRLEAQGEIQAGRFIKKFSGIQFAEKSFVKTIGKSNSEPIELHDKDCCNLRLN
ncbi:MAG: DEAD/DEAH box helicase [Gammaproteobacteria bacterium]|nr:DEAD/DEAH box helicase [Xanthomonadales bacterium]